MFKREIAIICIFSMLLLLASCGAGESVRQIYVMDSVASIRLIPKNEAAADLICKELYDMDNVLSAYDGEVYDINRNGEGKVSRHTEALLRSSLELYEKTNGAFSPLLGSVIDLWGIGSKNYIPSQDEKENAVAASDIGNVAIEGDVIRLSGGARLSFGAVAKGYASDVIKSVLEEQEVEGAVISLGGNVYVHGKKPDGELWRVAIRDPRGGENSWLGTLLLSDRFVISSGDYERYFEQSGVRYHHIMDPETGSPAQSDLAAVAVICESGVVGDAYSTALYVMGKEKALSFWREGEGFELVLVGRDGVVTVTEGVADAFAPESGKGYSYETARR